MSCSRRTETSPGTVPTMPLFSLQKKLSSVSAPSGTLPLTFCDNTSQYLTGRPWCSTPAKWQTCGFCQQSPYKNQMPVCQHREGDASLLSLEQRDSECMSTVGSFTIKSDHKPLESISQENLADTPAHLQHMLLHFQGYDYTICYYPGKEMALPDTVSQFSPHPGPNMLLDITIHHACLSPERKEAFQKSL